MNNTETLKILSVLKVAYPNSYKDISKEDTAATAKLWQSMFADQPYELVATAVKMLIATSKWIPTISEVNEKIVELTAPPMLGEMEAWELVRRAICNSGYESRREFDRLPDTIRRIVGSPNMLREWAMMDIQTVQSVVQSNFMRSYRARATSEREFQMLPTAARNMLTECAAKLKSFPEVQHEAL